MAKHAEAQAAPRGYHRTAHAPAGLSVAEAAEAVGAGESTVRDRCHSGQLGVDGTDEGAPIKTVSWGWILPPEAMTRLREMSGGAE